jgi:hypothetical protein
MRRKYGALAGVLVGVLLMAAYASGQQPKGGTVGDKLDSAVQSIKRGAQEAGAAVRDEYNKMRASVHNMSVSSRIYGRLHWDKVLTDRKIDIEMRKDGVAVLTGAVPDAKAKMKAVELTRDTVGVNDVLDRLTIAPADSAASEGVTPATPKKP